jgi:hypothetical protein
MKLKNPVTELRKIIQDLQQQTENRLRRKTQKTKQNKKPQVIQLYNQKRKK